MCAVAWFDDNIVSVLGNTTVLFGVFGCSFILIFAYGSICAVYRMANVAVRDAFNPSTNSTNIFPLQTKQDVYKWSPAEKTLLLKCVSVTSTFGFLFSPYMVKILYECATKTPVDGTYDAIAGIFIACNPIANALLVLFFDSRIAKALEAFRIR